MKEGSRIEAEAFLLSVIFMKVVLLLSGLHCTHGFNRTGFLIVSYLVEKLDWA